jgi:hypothetical protein
MIPRASNGSGEPPGKLKDMAWIVGTWTGQLPIPGGQTATLNTKFYLINNNHFLRAETELILAGNVFWSKEDTWFWDPVGNVVRRIQFESNGEWLDGEVYVYSDDDKATFRSYDQGVNPDTMPFSRSVIVRKTGTDTWTYQEFGIALGADRQANEQEDYLIDLRRVSDS